MTREKEIAIQRAWDRYKFPVEILPCPSKQFVAGFAAGEEYAGTHPAKKQSIWNNVNETPSENSEIVVIDTKKEWYNISYSFDEYDDTFGKGWESCVRTYDIDKWAYLNDLINL